MEGASATFAQPLREDEEMDLAQAVDQATAYVQDIGDDSGLFTKSESLEFYESVISNLESSADALLSEINAERGGDTND